MARRLCCLAVTALLGVAAAAEDCAEEVPQFLQKSLQLQDLHSNIQTDAVKVASRAKAKEEGDVPATYHFYAKFHGVDPVLATLMNVLYQSSSVCASCDLELMTCEEQGLNESECLLQTVNETCLATPRSCSADGGLKVLEAASIAGKNFTDVNTTDLASLKNLWADQKRYKLFAGSALAAYWLPQQWGPGKRIVFTTILRDPVERLRSVFYSLSSNRSSEHFKDFLLVQRDVAFPNQSTNTTNTTNKTLGWHWRKAIQGCCEYVHYLGNGDVEKSKKILVSQFNFVGIAEDLPQTLVTLAWLYGKTPEGMGILARDVQLKVPKKEQWEAKDLELATNVTAKDREIYDFATNLSKRQAVSMWNNEKVLKKQAEKLQDAWNIPWEPE